MNETKKSGTTFGLGLIIGTVLGGLTAFFLSPKSGKENREEVLARLREFKTSLDEADIPAQVKEIYGESTREGIKLYTQVRKELSQKYNGIKEKIDGFDPDTYSALIEDTVEHVRAELGETAERASKLKNYLVKNWSKTLKSSKSSARKTKE